VSQCQPNLNAPHDDDRHRQENDQQQPFLQAADVECVVRRYEEENL
jgi:hypothetical protein